MLEHTGSGDMALIGHDPVLTTYGTLLRDAAQLAQMNSITSCWMKQAVKNSSTALAKAVRCCAARIDRPRGTPVENHLGEL